MSKQYIFKVLNRLYLTLFSILSFFATLFLLATPIGFWNEYQREKASQCFYDEIRKNEGLMSDRKTGKFDPDSFLEKTKMKPWEKYQTVVEVDYSSEVYAESRYKCNIVSSRSYNSELSVYETKWTLFSADKHTYKIFLFFLGFLGCLFSMKKYLIWLFKD